MLSFPLGDAAVWLRADLLRLLRVPDLVGAGEDADGRRPVPHQRRPQQHHLPPLRPLARQGPHLPLPKGKGKEWTLSLFDELT